MLRLWENKSWAWPLWPLSLAFASVVRIRTKAYEHGRKTSHRLNAHVISVGNITVGGTGKTPTVIALAQRMKQQGLSVAVISRGYGSQSGNIRIVSDGNQLLLPIHQAGDEPALMAKNLPGVPIVIGADRPAAGRLAIDTFHATHLIADDAMQHHRLKRDADLVLMDATRPWGNGWILPAGPLREPLTRLSRAHAILLTRTDLSGPDLPDVQRRISRYSPAPQFISEHRPDAWRQHDWTLRPLNAFQGTPCWAFSGIGHPEAFRKTLEKAGTPPLGMTAFKDHHWYQEKDIEKLMRTGERHGAKVLVTTEKDLIRIPPLPRAMPIIALRIVLNIHPGLDGLINHLLQRTER